jgi:hypothetical protein
MEKRKFGTELLVRDGETAVQRITQEVVNQVIVDTAVQADEDDQARYVALLTPFI